MSDGVEGGKVWGYKPEVNKPVDKFDLLEYIKFFGEFSFISLVAFLSSYGFTYLAVRFSAVSREEYYWVHMASTIVFLGLSAYISFNGMEEKNFSWLRSIVTFSHLSIMIISLSFSINSYIDNLYDKFHPVVDETTVVEELEYEYGYTGVDPGITGETTTVDNGSGEKITVDIMNYKDKVIVYENETQLKEKMAKVDAGTYGKDDND